MKILKNILFSLAIIIIIFSLVEFSAKIVNPLLKLSHGNAGLMIGGKDALEYPAGYIKDRDLFWKLESNKHGYNSFGMRDREFSRTKTDGTYRIICMGDSVTFGWPTPPEETYPKILEKILNTKSINLKYEVLNAGVPGYTSYQGLKFLEKDILSYNPDLIVVYFGINDMGLSIRPDKDQKPLPYWVINAANLLRKFNSFKLINKISLYSRFPPDKQYSVSRVSQDDFGYNLKKIKKIAYSYGIKVVFIINPAFYDPERKIIIAKKGYSPQALNPSLDIYTLFKKRENEAPNIFLDDCRPLNFHLKVYGQRVLAEAVFDLLVKDRIIEFKN